ncbi:MAG TPA: Gfo/Idh/MocA family oxidoreductase [Phycisphaerae bacterium]|nr:Gfo/Idh/MocA family oxidoreductase [Phycisphaerae bacterium]
MKLPRLTRRRFLKRAAALTGAAAVAQAGVGPLVLAEGAAAPKLRCAVIGCNGQGMASVHAAAGERIVALVDADDKRLAATLKELAAKYPDSNSGAIKTYFDYRRLFDEMAKDIDVVFVATPDHHHASASMRAIKLGKHVFCEKPLAHTIHECRALAEAARAANVRTQMGNQGHCADGYRRLCEYIWAGAIGNVLETHTWIGMVNGGTGGRPPSRPMPEGLHWEEWLGPAPYRDFHPGLHPGAWRSWWDFGNGTLGDWGCHQLDGVFWALKLGHATSVECLEMHGGSDERYPLGSAVRYEFPARGNMPPVKVHWYDGVKDDPANPGKQVPVRPALVAEFEQKYNRKFDQSWGGGGTLYIGDKGVMVTGNYGSGPRILPEEAHKAFPVPAESLPRIRGGHFADFLRACRDGKPAAAEFSYAGPFTEGILLGHLAYKAGIGKRVEWDGAAMRTRNMPELDRWIRREHRKGWEL